MQAAVRKKMARGQNFAAFSLMEPKVAVRDWGCNGTSHTSRSSSSMIDEIDLSFHETKEDQSLLTASWAMMQKEPRMIPASYDPSSYALSNSISGLNWSVEGKLSALLDDKLCLSDWSNAKAGSMSHPCNKYLSSLSGIECETSGSLLQDVDDLLSNAALDVDSTIMDSYSEENEELDLFSSGGGLELENDCQGANNWLKKNAEPLTGSGVGEHPYYEHPSRTLFARNINSSVDDAELRVLFEQFGDIRTLYTACKHRGFVIISYYDIRAARSAMRALQNKSLRRRKLDIHFSIPKENSSEKDVNQGTLVVFNLDSSISNDELRQMFGVYGEVKEIRETPHKKHHKFIEFYDVRSAEAALRALNRCDIAGKRIKVEPSRPGGARRSLMQNLPPLDFEQEKNILKEPSGAFFKKSVPDARFFERDPVHEACQSKFIGHGWHPLAPLVPASAISEQVMGTEPGRFNASAAAISAIKNPMCSDHLIKMGIKGFNMSSSLESASGGGILTDSLHPCSMDNLPANSFLTSSCNALYQKENFSILSSHLPARSPCGMNRFVSHDEIKPYPPFPGAPILPLNHCHVGSAPVTAFPFLDRNHVYIGESLDSITAAGSLDGGPGFSARHCLELSPSSNHSPGALISSGLIAQGPCSSAWSILQQQKGNSSSLTRTVHDLFASHSDRSMERGRGRKTDNGVSHYDKKQYELDIELIFRGEDLRTTLMIKNIPNKYTSKMLLAAIDENHRGTYDFIYLPIDFKNKCNVGYAFINMTEPSRIIPFYKAFNGKRWEKFNSEKVASLAYARIQGKAALIAHFQNSSLMNEDKRCRPILFHSDGPNVGGQEPFPIGTNPRIRLSKGRSSYHGSFLGRY